MAQVGKKSREEKLRVVLSVLRGESAAVARRGLHVCVRLGVVVAVLSVAVVSLPAAAQDSGVDVRIVARKLDSGKIEFGLREQQSDGSWGEPLLPTRRLFPATAAVGSWLVSSSLSLGAANSEESVRITARRLADGRVEFALQQQRADNSWGDRMLPSQRFFPTTARVDRWLQSSPLTITTTTAPVENQQVEEDPEEPTTTTTTAPPENLGPLPPNNDYWDEVMRIENFAIACGWYEDEYKQCRNHPEDTQIIIRDLGNLYNCEWDVGWGMCFDQTIAEFLFRRAQLACFEYGEEWYFDMSVPACYHLDHPREGEWVSGRWTDL